MKSSSLNILRRTIGPFFVEVEKQNQTLSSFAIIFILIIVIFGARPVLLEVIRLNQELSQGAESQKRLNRKISDLNEAIENYDKADFDKQLIDRALPESKDLPYLLERLNFIFGTNNLNLEEVRLEEPKTSKSDLLALPLHIRVSGTYENLLSALEGLEGNIRQLDVTEISIETPQKGNKQLLSVSLSLESYFLRRI